MCELLDQILCPQWIQLWEILLWELIRGSFQDSCEQPFFEQFVAIIHNILRAAEPFVNVYEEGVQLGQKHLL